jgi:hypothetical protein
MGSARARGPALRANAPRFDRGFVAQWARGAKSAMAGVFRAAELSLCCLLLAATPGHAQSPPSDPISTAVPASLSGLVPPYEINKIARAAGFSPLAPPQREGTTYVLRAIDSREILMRVVVDARSGAIRAVNRIVPARSDSVVGMMPPPGPPPYEAPPNEPLPGPPPSGPPPHDVPPSQAIPADIEGPPMGPKEADVSMLPPPLTTPPGTHTAPQGAQPLPRPRPPELTMQKAKPPGKVPKAPAVKPNGAPAAASIPSAAPRPAPATPKEPPRIATPN